MIKTFDSYLITRALIVAFCFLLNADVFGQNGQVNYGQNRVQYKEFDWQFYETDNFNVYFYQGGQDIGKYVIQVSEKIAEDVAEQLDFRISSRMNVIVYNDISDMHQTNIGIKKDQEYITGTTRIADNKMFLYFNGDHRDLDAQIKEGISRLYVNKIVAGSGFQEVVQNAISLNLPYWFTEGLIKFVSEDWNVAHEDKLTAGILSGKYEDIYKLNKEDQAFVGQALWRSFQSKYGDEAVTNLLYLVRVNRNLDRGFMFTTGSETDRYIEEWYQEKLQEYNSFAVNFDSIDFEESLPIKFKKNLNYYGATISPNGQQMAYVQNDIGRWKIKVVDLETFETKTIFKGGFRTTTLETDESVPLIDWSPNGMQLTAIYERKDLFYLVHFDNEKFKHLAPMPMRKFQKVFGFEYAQDSKNLVLSAMQKAQVDVFTYYMPSTKVVNLTKDFYDDLQPSYAEIDGRKGVLFVSNRPNDELNYGKLDSILPNGNMDVFFYDLNSNSQPLAQLTKTPDADEHHPKALGDSAFTFISDYTGIRSQYIGQLERTKLYDKKYYFFYTNEFPNDLDSVLLDPEIPLDSAMAFGETVKEIVRTEDVPIYRIIGKSFRSSNYVLGISEYDLSDRSTQVLRYENVGKPKYFIRDAGAVAVQEELFQVEPEVKETKQTENGVDVEEEAVVDTVIPRKVFYQSKFDGRAPNFTLLEELGQGSSEEESANNYKFSRTRQYFIKFKTEEVNFSADNAQLVTNYQPFNPGSPIFSQADFNTMTRFGITDLFENHKIHGGFRLPINFSPFSINGNELYVTYENFKKRWDKKLTFYRKSLSEDYLILAPGQQFAVPGKVKINTNVVESEFKYPFNNLNRIDIKFGFRSDRYIIKATDTVTLGLPNFSQNWLFSRVEFVHDHTVQRATNIKQGFRVNTFFEFHKEIPTAEDTIFGDVPVQLPQLNNGYIMVFGFDARHYQKVYKTITWANRLSYSSSVGTRKIIYYLGATDNTLFPTFNTETPINVDNNYAYQTIAWNMRGFQQNVRNGNSYMVLNSEIRIPIFTAFSKKPPKSPLLESIQIIGFTDVGTAWEGITPFSDDNPLFNEETTNNGGSVVIRIKKQKQPLVIGFGTGIRGNLLGYYLRADIGWGYDTGTVSKARFQLSLGHDF